MSAFKIIFLILINYIVYGNSQSLRTTYSHTHWWESLIFNINAYKSVNINSFDFMCWQIGTYPFSIYKLSIFNQNYLPYTTLSRSSVWTSIYFQNINCPARNTILTVTLNTPVFIHAGTTQAFWVEYYGIVGQKAGSGYTNLIFASNADIAILYGSGIWSNNIYNGEGVSTQVYYDTNINTTAPTMQTDIPSFSPTLTPTQSTIAPSIPPTKATISPTIANPFNETKFAQISGRVGPANLDICFDIIDCIAPEINIEYIPIDYDTQIHEYIKVSYNSLTFTCAAYVSQGCSYTNKCGPFIPSNYWGINDNKCINIQVGSDVHNLCAGQGLLNANVTLSCQSGKTFNPTEATVAPSMEPTIQTVSPSFKPSVFTPIIKNVVCGERINGSISRYETNFYRVVNIPNITTSITFDSCGSSYDTWIQVYNHRSSLLYECDDCGICGIQTILSFTSFRGFQADKDYIVGIKGFGPSFGDYTLQIDCTMAPTPSPTRPIGIDTRITEFAHITDLNGPANLTVCFDVGSCEHPAITVEYLPIDYDSWNEYINIKYESLSYVCARYDQQAICGRSNECGPFSLGNMLNPNDNKCITFEVGSQVDSLCGRKYGILYANVTLACAGTLTPTTEPTTGIPTISPTINPTESPTSSPINAPTNAPTIDTILPTSVSVSPTVVPTHAPTKGSISPTKPTVSPSKATISPTSIIQQPNDALLLDPISNAATFDGSLLDESELAVIFDTESVYISSCYASNTKSGVFNTEVLLPQITKILMVTVNIQPTGAAINGFMKFTDLNGIKQSFKTEYTSDGYDEENLQYFTQYRALLNETAQLLSIDDINTNEIKITLSISAESNIKICGVHIYGIPSNSENVNIGLSSSNKDGNTTKEGNKNDKTYTIVIIILVVIILCIFIICVCMICRNKKTSSFKNESVLVATSQDDLQMTPVNDPTKLELFDQGNDHKILMNSDDDDDMPTTRDIDGENK